MNGSADFRKNGSDEAARNVQFRNGTLKLRGKCLTSYKYASQIIWKKRNAMHFLNPRVWQVKIAQNARSADPFCTLGARRAAFLLFLQLAGGEEAQADPDDREGRKLHQIEGFVEYKDT